MLNRSINEINRHTHTLHTRAERGGAKIAMYSCSPPLYLINDVAKACVVGIQFCLAWTVKEKIVICAPSEEEKGFESACEEALDGRDEIPL